MRDAHAGPPGLAHVCENREVIGMDAERNHRPHRQFRRAPAISVCELRTNPLKHGIDRNPDSPRRADQGIMRFERGTREIGDGIKRPF
mgnify:CR=1 FL=1